MAKATKQKSIEETLWDSANKLRGSVESAEYKHVVLGLIFLKFVSDKFEQRRSELIAEGKEKYGSPEQRVITKTYHEKQARKRRRILSKLRNP